MSFDAGEAIPAHFLTALTWSDLIGPPATGPEVRAEAVQAGRQQSKQQAADSRARSRDRARRLDLGGSISACSSREQQADSRARSRDRARRRGLRSIQIQTVTKKQMTSSDRLQLRGFSGYSLAARKYPLAVTRGDVFCRWQAQQRPDPSSSDACTSAPLGRYFPAPPFG
jgi:hypothetical protein